MIIGSTKYIARAVLAMALFVMFLPGMIIAWDSLSKLSGEACYDNRTGQRWVAPGMVGNAEGECVSASPAGEYSAYGEYTYRARADGVAEPTVYYSWRGPAQTENAVARIAQVGMLVSLLLATMSMMYLLLPVYEEKG